MRKTHSGSARQRKRTNPIQCPGCLSQFVDDIAFTAHRKVCSGIVSPNHIRKARDEAERTKKVRAIERKEKRKSVKGVGNEATALANNKRKLVKMFGKRGTRLYESFQCEFCAIKTDNGWRYRAGESLHIRICNQCKARMMAKRKPSPYAESRLFVQGGGIEKNRRKF